MLSTGFIKLLLALSNWEAFFSHPSSQEKLWIRRCFLKLCKIQPPKNFWIGQGFILMHVGIPNVSLGKNCAIGENSVLANHASIAIGDDFLAAGGLVINTGSHDPTSLFPQCKSVRIGSRVWCGQNVTIMSGVEIGNDVVIGAGSLVLASVPSNSIIAGSPARLIRPLNRPSNIKLWSWSI